MSSEFSKVSWHLGEVSLVRTVPGYNVTMYLLLLIAFIIATTITMITIILLVRILILS